MRAPTDNLNDLESDIGNLSRLLEVVTGMLLDHPRSEREVENTLLDQIIALTIIGRDMSEQMVTAMAMCHARVIAEARARRKGGSLQ